MEKRIRATIDADGNGIKFETVEGFAGTSCETDINAVCAGLNDMKQVGEGDTDDRYREEEAEAFATALK